MPEHSRGSPDESSPSSSLPSSAYLRWSHAMSQDSTPWKWSDRLQQHYYPGVANGRPVFVLESGQVVPAPSSAIPSNPSGRPAASSSDPRSVPRPPQTIETGSTDQGYGQPGPSYTYGKQRPPSQGQSELTEQFRKLNVEGASGSNSASGQQPRQPSFDEGRSPYGVVSRVKSGTQDEHLLPTPGDVEQLDGAYKIRRPDFFKEGRVFFILWTEPSAAAGKSTAFSTVRFGQTAYSQIRRFVIVREGQGYCLAAPIMTYGRQGVGKGGVTKCEHAIIHTGNQKPQILPGEVPRENERPMLSTSIQVMPDVSGETLDSRSRVNLGKISTIEHNLKVKPFGNVRDTQVLKSAWVSVLKVPSSGGGTAKVSGRSGRQRSSSNAQTSMAGGSSLSPIAGSLGSVSSPRPRPSQPQRVTPSSVSQRANAMQRNQTSARRQVEEEEEESSSESEESSDESDDDSPNQPRQAQQNQQSSSYGRKQYQPQGQSSYYGRS